MKVIDVVQGTPEWRQARCARVTASNVDAVLSRARDRKSEGSTRRKYKARIIAEILTGRPQEDPFTNKAIEDGIEREPFGRAAYEIKRGVFVEKVGIVVHPTLERSSASPDGLVDDDGLVQIKCPFASTHIDYRLEGCVPTTYQPQMQWEMACTGRKWCDFVSYCPDFDEEVGLFICRLERNDVEIARITAEVVQFLREADEIVERLRATVKKAA